MNIDISRGLNQHSPAEPECRELWKMLDEDIHAMWGPKQISLRSVPVGIKW